MANFLTDEGASRGVNVPSGSSPSEVSDAGLSRSWRLDLENVSSRLGVRMAHLVEGMRKSTGDFEVISPQGQQFTSAREIRVPNGQQQSAQAHSLPTASILMNRNDADVHAVTGRGRSADQFSSMTPPPASINDEHAPLINPYTKSYKTINIPASLSPEMHPSQPPIRAGSNSLQRSADTLESGALPACSEVSNGSFARDALIQCDPPTLRLPTLEERSASVSPPVPECRNNTQECLSVDGPTEVKKDRRVNFLSFDGSPISTVHIYEAIHQEAIVMDVKYVRPKWVWLCLIIINAGLAYSAAELQRMEHDSDLEDSVAAPILAWWMSVGQSVILALAFPCLWMPTREERTFLSTRSGKVSFLTLCFVMTIERSLTQVSLNWCHSGGKVPAHIAVTQYAFVLLLGRAFLLKRTIPTEAITTGFIVMGMGLMMGNAMQSNPDYDTKRMLMGIFIGVIASCFASLELVLAHRLRNSVTLILLLTVGQLISTAFHLPVAFLWGASGSDIFNEIGTYAHWRYATVVLALTISNACMFHILSFLHPVTVALALSAQCAFVLPFVEGNSHLLGAGYLIGVINLLFGSGWGCYLSARIRRNVSVEVPLS
eukprot:TRINITY_DN1160_c0_g1_i12.p1 TRINITY_DN1160_c0_g1~~TRINITY_DN1160_c0_g1_i12.p1  ORF type:complete len:602 (+),score=72.06 TRINITY_DN1160_c0_g1_i12:60-1865(+)